MCLLKTALEFWTSMNPDRTLAVPPEVVSRLGDAQAIRVILLIPDADHDEAWARLTAEQFVSGYADSDAIYDDPAAR